MEEAAIYGRETINIQLFFLRPQAGSPDARFAWRGGDPRVA
jgi:hypothetical protein